MGIAKIIVNSSPYPRVVSSVHVYRGLPDADKEPRGYAAAQRQNQVWRDNGVKVTPRPLQYPDTWPSLSGEKPREKGIDVQLALDFTIGAVEKRYEVGVLFSGDTDLKPALEYVAKLTKAGGPRAEVAAWSTDDPRQHNRRLSIKGSNLWCHWLDRGKYILACDTRDYARRA